MKNYLFITAILFLSYWAIKSLFIPGFFPIHDDTQVSRVYEMSKALEDGMFPVRWVADLGYGYGYPLFNFYAPLSYYFGGLLTILGMDPLLATKITFSMGILMAGVFMFLLGKTLWGNWGGMVSAILYMYAPYSALNIYVRGDLSEVWGYGFVPLFFYGIINIYKNLSLKYILFSSLGLAGIVLSHNLTAYMTSIIFVFVVIFLSVISKNKFKFITFSLLGFALGCLLSSFYFIPALLEMEYTNVFSQIGGGANFRDHFVCLIQFWQSDWGFGGSAPGCLDGMSFRVGKLHLTIAFISLFILFIKSEKARRIWIAFLGISFFFSLFLMISVSKFVWENLPLMEFLQYPWRFLVYASFFVSLIAGGSVVLVKFLPANVFKHASAEYTAIIIFIAVYTYSKFFIPQTILPKTSADYIDKLALNYKISRISDEYLPKEFSKPKKLEEIPANVLNVNGKGNIELLERKNHVIKARANLNQELGVHVNIAYFPAWKVLVNGKEADVTVKNNGFEFKAPKGRSEISIAFEETNIEKASNVLSLIGLITIITGIIFRRKLTKLI